MRCKRTHKQHKVSIIIGRLKLYGIIPIVSLNVVNYLFKIRYYTYESTNKIDVILIINNKFYLKKLVDTFIYNRKQGSYSIKLSCF